jgi:hypothetical protein
MWSTIDMLARKVVGKKLDARKIPAAARDALIKIFPKVRDLAVV